MKKYMIYREPEESEDDLGKRELIGVEYGEDISAVTGELIHTVTTDIYEDPTYAGCLNVCAYGPDITLDHHQTKGDQFFMIVSIEMPNTDENILVEYLVIETKEA